MISGSENLKCERIGRGKSTKMQEAITVIQSGKRRGRGENKIMDTSNSISSGKVAKKTRKGGEYANSEPSAYASAQPLIFKPSVQGMVNENSQVKINGEIDEVPHKQKVGLRDCKKKLKCLVRLAYCLNELYPTSDKIFAEKVLEPQDKDEKNWQLKHGKVLRQLSKLMADPSLDFSSKYATLHDWQTNLILEDAAGTTHDIIPNEAWTTTSNRNTGRDLRVLLRSLKNAYAKLQCNVDQFGRDGISIWQFKQIGGVGFGRWLHAACVAHLLYKDNMDAAMLQVHEATGDVDVDLLDMDVPVQDGMGVSAVRGPWTGQRLAAVPSATELPYRGVGNVAGPKAPSALQSQPVTVSSSSSSSKPASAETTVERATKFTAAVEVAKANEDLRIKRLEAKMRMIQYLNNKSVEEKETMAMDILAELDTPTVLPTFDNFDALGSTQT